MYFWNILEGFTAVVIENHYGNSYFWTILEHSDIHVPMEKGNCCYAVVHLWKVLERNLLMGFYMLLCKVLYKVTV